ncbi:hypothetical protein NDU88_001445 [Pleurodeles waltl]|uniref:Uncharacterized protein n=1 Tax=Pleurodeles waltl TaxID=8319 RepID=A0AAV7SZ83_PLEWA|nr:hypothetical protein NDU88_001445 [Pleurodeles waltl]
MMEADEERRIWISIGEDTKGRRRVRIEGGDKRIPYLHGAACSFRGREEGDAQKAGSLNQERGVRTLGSGTRSPATLQEECGTGRLGREKISGRQAGKVARPGARNVLSGPRRKRRNAKTGAAAMLALRYSEQWPDRGSNKGRRSIARHHN